MLIIALFRPKISGFSLKLASLYKYSEIFYRNSDFLLDIIGLLVLYYDY